MQFFFQIKIRAAAPRQHYTDTPDNADSTPPQQLRRSDSHHAHHILSSSSSTSRATTMAAFALSKLKMSGRLVVEPFAPKDIFDAAFIGDMQAVRAFADVEGWDKDAQEHITGRTALHKCCQGSQGRVLTFLLEHHCSTTMTDSHGMNAIHIAERYGYKVSVRRKLSLHRSLFFSLSLPPPPPVCVLRRPRVHLSRSHTHARARALSLH